MHKPEEDFGELLDFPVGSIEIPDRYDMAKTVTTLASAVSLLDEIGGSHLNLLKLLDEQYEGMQEDKMEEMLKTLEVQMQKLTEQLEQQAEEVMKQLQRTDILISHDK